ncbi:MAG: MFS transporter [Gammaproteobacteria bacterium]|nr:MFS transporter [Gammaproteobacteria bacterium]
MAKLKMACGALILLVISFSFSSFFTLTALAKLYAQSLSGFGPSSGLQALLSQLEIDAFIDAQLLIALVILLSSGLMVLALIAWRAPSAPAQWSLQNIGWPLFSVSGLAQLLALGLYISHFVAVAPVEQASAAGLLDVLIEIATTLVIAALLLVELLILLLKLLQNDSALNHSASLAVDPDRIRPVVFLMLFGVDLSAAFVPLHMKNLYQPLWDLPEDVVLGLPISAMFLSVSVAIVVSGIWLDRRGWHEPLLAGLVLTTSAMLYAWLAPNGMHFIVAMGLAGFGYGLALMAPQGFVMVHTDNKNKARGLAYLFASLYAGSICGTAAGAMLAERVGYRPVFLLSAIMVFLAMNYTWCALRSTFKQTGRYERRTAHRYNRLPLSDTSKSTTSQESSTEYQHVLASVTVKHYWNFLSDRYVLSLIFLSSLPSAVAVVGLLNYFVPVYLDSLNVSQSIIGSVLMTYGVCMVYVGPFVSRYIDASDNKRLFVIAGCVLGGFAFLIFQFLNGLSATIVAVLLLGLSSCFVLASQTTYALTLDVTQQLGQGRAIGIFRASSRIGQMLGPILFSGLVMVNDIHQGLVHFGLGYVAMAILFALATSAKPVLIKGGQPS